VGANGGEYTEWCLSLCRPSWLLCFYWGGSNGDNKQEFSLYQEEKKSKTIQRLLACSKNNTQSSLSFAFIAKSTFPYLQVDCYCFVQHHVSALIAATNYHYYYVTVIIWLLTMHTATMNRYKPVLASYDLQVVDQLSLMLTWHSEFQHQLMMLTEDDCTAAEMD